jgi:hypothetical protein
MKRQHSIGHLETEIHFHLIPAGSAATLEAALFRNGC